MSPVKLSFVASVFIIAVSVSEFSHPLFRTAHHTCNKDSTKKAKERDFNVI